MSSHKHKIKIIGAVVVFVLLLAVVLGIYQNNKVDSKTESGKEEQADSIPKELETQKSKGCVLLNH